jgi:hypothetical protein
MGDGIDVPWLEAQTGVAYATLKRHYAGQSPDDRERLLRKFGRDYPEMFDLRSEEIVPHEPRRGGQSKKTIARAAREKCERGDLNPKRAPKSRGKSRR